MSRRTQKFEVYFANERPVPAFISTKLVHVFGSDVGNKIGVILRERRPDKLEFAYETVRIHSLMI